MFERVLKRLRELVRERRFILTIHADEEMDDEGLTVHDLECAILTGTILERQRDEARD